MIFGVVQSENLPGVKNVPFNREANGKAIKELFDKGAHLIVLPECSNHQYILNSAEEVRDYSEPLDGKSVTYWSEIAAFYGGYIVGGILEQTERCVYNTAVLIGPNGYIGHYRKVHLFNWEKSYLNEGDLGFPTFQLEKLGIKVGMLVCYDLRFPEAVRSLAMKSCDVLLVPTTWTSIGKSMLWDANGYCLANYLAIAHTYTNKFAIVCANRAGIENGVQCLGSSIIVDSTSKVVGGPGSKLEADQILGEFDPNISRKKEIGKTNDLLQDRRPEYYFKSDGSQDFIKY